MGNKVIYWHLLYVDVKKLKKKKKILLKRKTNWYHFFKSNHVFYITVARLMFTVQMLTLMPWTQLGMEVKVGALHFLRISMNIKQLLWDFLVNHILYHHGQWVYCQTAGMLCSTLPRYGSNFRILCFMGNMELVFMGHILAWKLCTWLFLLFSCDYRSLKY